LLPLLWGRGLAARPATVGQILGESLVVDAQRPATVPARSRGSAVVARRGGIALPALLRPWRRSVSPRRSTPICQILGKPLVVDTQRPATVPARRLRATFIALLLGILPVPSLLLLDALRLCFGEGRARTRTLAAQRAAPGGLPVIGGRGGFLFQSECDHVVVLAPTQDFRNGTPLRLCYLLLQY
jgi:hypothetical protein